MLITIGSTLMKYLFLLTFVLTLAGCEKVLTKVEKQKLSMAGGHFIVTVYSSTGNVVKQYNGNGYVVFEGQNKEAIVFQSKDKQMHRIIANGGIIDIEY